MTKFLIGVAMAGVAGIAVAQAPATPPAQHHQMMQQPQTRDQVVVKVREHFGKMDANRDGVVAQDEMKAMRGHHRQMMADGHRGMHRGGAMGDPNAAFDRLDANRDGSISRDEFAKGREIRIEKRVEMKDGRGRGAMRGMHRGGGMHMMRMADGNRDGRITLAEAEAAALRHFDMMDANRDGQVTREERRQMRMKMRTERMHKAG